MAIYYSPSQKGFFLCGFGDAPPQDGVEVTPERHQELLDLQSTGLMICMGEDGPVAVPPPMHVVTPDEVMEWARSIIWEAYKDEAPQASTGRYFTELTALRVARVKMTPEMKADFDLMIRIFKWEQSVLDFARDLIASGNMDGYRDAEWPEKPDGMDDLINAC